MAVVDTSEALSQLGASSELLSAAQKRALDEQGYVALPAVLSSQQVEKLRAALRELLQAEGDRAGHEVHQEPGTERLADLVNKDPVFTTCISHPLVLAAIAHVLENDLKLSSLNARAAQPGHGHQALHTDYGETPPGHYRVCNSIWLLDDFTTENGATRVVPGSHLRGQMPSTVLPDPAAPHPEQVLLLAPAGSVVVFNSHLWHGGTLNRSPASRRAVHAYFCRRADVQQLDQRRYLRPSTRERLSAAQRWLLDVD